MFVSCDCHMTMVVVNIKNLTMRFYMCISIAFTSLQLCRDSIIIRSSVILYTELCGSGGSCVLWGEGEGGG